MRPSIWAAKGMKFCPPVATFTSQICLLVSESFMIIRKSGRAYNPRINSGFPLEVLPLRWPSVEKRRQGSPLQATGPRCNLHRRVNEEYVLGASGTSSNILRLLIWVPTSSLGRIASILLSKSTRASCLSSDPSGQKLDIGCGAPRSG